MRFALVNLGCKVNRVESDTIVAQLESRGHTLSDEGARAVVVNTCTVTGEADKKARKAVRRALKDHPDARVLVTGCAAALHADDFEAIDDRVIVCGKAAVADICDELAPEGEGPACPNPVAPVRFGEEFPTRAGLKIQDGCDNACTYCIVHVARGKARSLPLSQVLVQARALADAGAREIVLTGINLGSYRSEGATLAGAALAVRDALPGVRVRISSVEPRDVTPELSRALATSDGWICRHLHLPLQAGSTRVLADMDRPYTAKEYRDIVDSLYRDVPGLSLSTDIIVGFPGETEQDFQDTLDMARVCRFSKIHVFRYSKRAGTPAAARLDQIPADVIADRAHRLSALARELRQEAARSREGSLERVLVESEGRGTSESYFPVEVNGIAPRGSLIDLQLKTFTEEGAFRL